MASATRTMPRASGIVSSPKNENECACRIHRAKGETFPSLGGDRIRGRLSPRGLCYSPAGDCRRGMSSPSPIWGRSALRHAHASHVIDEGAPITLVSQTLGHADLKTTSVYAHARPNDSSSRYLKIR